MSLLYTVYLHDLEAIKSCLNGAENLHKTLNAFKFGVMEISKFKDIERQSKYTKYTHTYTHTDSVRWRPHVARRDRC